MSGLEILGGLAATEQFIEVLFKTVQLIKSLVDQIQDGPNQVRQRIERLESITLLAKKIQTRKSLQTEDIVLILCRCECLVQSLHRLLHKITFQSLDSIRKKTLNAIYSLQYEEQILKLFDQLDHEYNLLNTHINLRTMAMTEGLQTEVDTFGNQLRTMDREADPTPNSQKCLRDLFITDPKMDRADLITSKGEPIEGTCDWIVQREEYLEWKDGNGGLLWISGGPGQGKTMLSIHLTKYLSTCFGPLDDERRHLATYFFCDAKQQTRNNAVAILRSLLFQLLEQDEGLISRILPRYSIQRERLFQKDSFEALWSIFLEMANDIGISQITCVLDGLDECEPLSLGPMLKKLNEVTSTAPRLKIVIVSREYPQCIGASLYKFPRIRLDPDAQREVSEGLDQYISTRVTELSESNRYPAKLADHVYDVLKRKSAGTYLWVSFVIEDLQAVKISEVEKCLERFPRGLDGLYARLLEQVDPACRETTLDILRWCAFTGPVTSDFLSDALNITSTGLLDREAVLQGYLAHCGHFLSITGHRIDLVHRSAHDFLTTCTRTSPSNALCWFSLSHIEAEHSKLASACISHICTHNPKATLENYSSSEAMEGSFVGHAHRAWIYHFHHSGQEGVRILDEHAKFFSRAPQSWTTKAYWGLSEYPEGLAAAAAQLGLTVLMQRIIKEDGSWLYVKDSLAHFAGQPLVHIAAAWGHAPIADTLLKKYKTLVNGKDVDGNTPLHHAALHGHLDVVKVLVKYGARIDSRDSNGQTPLYKALISSEKQVAEYLLELGANANASDKAGFSPLARAVHRGDPSMVKLLLDWGVDSQLRECDGSSSDVARALKRHPGTLMVFLESLAKRSDSEPSEFRDGIDFADTTALHIACQAGDLAAIRLLLDPKWGLDVNQQDDDENTPLRWAAGGGKVGAVELLLTQPGIDPTLLNEEGHSALHTALMRGCLNVVWYLLNNCNLSIHEPHAECGWGALHLAIFSQPCPRIGEPASTLWKRDDILVHILRFLVEGLGVDPRRRTPPESPCGECDPHEHSLCPTKGIPQLSCYESPLSFAIQRGIEKAVWYFLTRCKICPRAPCRGCDGATPLHLAAHSLRSQIVEQLISRWRVNVNATDDYQQTALHAVAKACTMHNDDANLDRRTIIKALVQAGGQISARDINGHTPRDLYVLNKTSTTLRGKWARGGDFDEIVKVCYSSS